MTAVYVSNVYIFPSKLLTYETESIHHEINCDNPCEIQNRTVRENITRRKIVSHLNTEIFCKVYRRSVLILYGFVRFLTVPYGPNSFYKVI